MLVLIAIDRVIEGEFDRGRELYSPPPVGEPVDACDTWTVICVPQHPLLHLVHGSDTGRHNDGPEDGWVQVDGGVCDMCMWA